MFRDPGCAAGPGGDPPSVDAHAVLPRRSNGLARDDTLPAIVLDAAVLLEAGWDDLCDRVVFVEAPRAERLRRVSASRGWSAEALTARERSQWPAEAKRNAPTGSSSTTDPRPAWMGRSTAC